MMALQKRHLPGEAFGRNAELGLGGVGVDVVIHQHRREVKAGQRGGGRKKPSSIERSYGLDHDALLAGLESYCARFGVTKEVRRVTDTRTA